MAKRSIPDIHADANRLQVYLERLKSGMVQDYQAEIARVGAAVERVLKDLDVAKLDDLTRRELESLLDDLRQAQLTVYSRANASLLDQLNDLGLFSAEREATLLTSWATQMAMNAPEFVVPSATKILKSVMDRPVRATGTLLDGFMASASQSSVDKIERAVRLGWAEGRTTGDIVREIRGTRALKYKDGIMATTTREAEALVRTSVQHVANTARAATWEANSDAVEGYRWISTLDTRTTAQCRSLDGKVFELNKGPLPPIHVNCRSTTVAYLGPEFDFFSDGGTRSSASGYVPAGMSYYEWLKTQDRAFVDDAIGPKRAQLLLDGGLSADEFAALNLGRSFEPLTLEEMRAKDAAAFKRAGL